MGLEQAGCQERTGPTSIIKTVRAAGGLQLIAPQGAEELAEPYDTRDSESLGLRLLRGVRRHGHGEAASKLEEPVLGEGLEDRAGGGGGHGERG